MKVQIFAKKFRAIFTNRVTHQGIMNCPSIVGGIHKGRLLQMGKGGPPKADTCDGGMGFFVHFTNFSLLVTLSVEVIMIYFN